MNPPEETYWEHEMVDLPEEGLDRSEELRVEIESNLFELAGISEPRVVVEYIEGLARRLRNELQGE